jgi:hypothetical protein
MTTAKVKEELMLAADTAQIQVANFVVALEGELKPTVIRAMLGHMRRILALLSTDQDKGVLTAVAKALGRDLPTPSRRYDTIWDIDRLFAWMTTHWTDNATMPLEDLQTKAMLLTMIFSACRLAELGRMQRPDTYSADAPSLTFTTILKQQQTLTQQIIIRRIRRAELCPVRAAIVWLQRAPASGDRFLFHALSQQGERP